MYRDNPIRSKDPPSGRAAWKGRRDRRGLPGRPPPFRSRSTPEARARRANSVPPWVPSLVSRAKLARMRGARETVVDRDTDPGVRDRGDRDGAGGRGVGAVGRVEEVGRSFG